MGMQFHLDQSAHFGLLPLNVCVKNRPQQKSLKVTRNATNRNKHINEASKQSFANILIKKSCKHTQGMLSNWKISLNVFNIL